MSNPWEWELLRDFFESTKACVRGGTVECGFTLLMVGIPLTIVCVPIVVWKIRRWIDAVNVEVHGDEAQIYLRNLAMREPAVAQELELLAEQWKARVELNPDVRIEELAADFRNHLSRRLTAASGGTKFDKETVAAVMDAIMATVKDMNSDASRSAPLPPANAGAPQDTAARAKH